MMRHLARALMVLAGLVVIVFVVPRVIPASGSRCPSSAKARPRQTRAPDDDWKVLA